MPVKQLLLTKYLFDKGQEALAAGDSFSAGLSISLFQDAVELMLWTIAKHYPVTVKDKDSFDVIWSNITKIEKDGIKLELPFSARMVELNKARVNFKHYGNLPAVSDAEKFRSYVDEFLHTTCQLYFGTSFASISLRDLIRNEEIKQMLKDSEAALAEGKVNDCIVMVAQAEYLAAESFKSLIPKFDSHFKNNLNNLFGRHDFDVYRLFEYLENYLNALRDTSIASLLGISLQSHLMFKRVAPSVTRALNGTFHVSLKPYGIKEEDCQMCIDYVTKLVLAMESKIANP